MKPQEHSILYLGDDPEGLGGVSARLERRGYRIFAAQNSDEGLLLATQLLPELILLDTTSPEPDGLASCKKLKTAPATHKIPLICLTSPGAAEYINACFEAGAADYLNKPLQFNEAIARIGVHLQLRNAQQQRHACMRFRQLLMDSHSDHIARFDSQCRYSYVSPSVVAAFNQPSEFFLGRTVCELPLPGNPAATRPLLDAARKTVLTGTVTALETEWPGGAGRFEVRHHPEFDEHGKVIGVLAIARDVTAQVQAEHRSELLSFALDQVREAAYLIDDDSMRILYVNQEASRALGYSREELLSMTICDIAPYFNLETSERVRQSLDTIGFMTFEAVHGASDGREFPVEVHVTRVIYQGKRTRIALARDITERKTAEEKIQRLSNLYAALSQCNQAIVRCDNKEALFEQICRDAVQFGKMKMAWIGLIDPSSGMIRPIASHGDGTDYLQGIEISADAASPLGRGPTGTAFRENKPFWCQDFQRAQITTPWHKRGAPYDWRASASLPLCENGAAIGAITVYAGQANAFDEAARNLLVEMATDINYALDRFSSEARRRQMEQALQESERRYRDVFDKASDALYLIEVTGDCHFHYLEVNPAFEKATGLSHAQLVGNYEDIVTPEIAATVNAKYQRCIDANAQIEEEIELNLPIGKRIFHSTLIPIQDKNGRVHRIVGISRDITASRQVEALQIQLTHLTENLPGFLYTYRRSRDGRPSIPFASEGIRELWALQPEDVAEDATPALAQIHPDDRDRVTADANLSAHEMSNFRCTFRIRHPTLGERWIEARATPERTTDGGLLWYGIMLDVSEQKRAQELLEKREREYRTLAENSPDHIARYDRQCRKLYVNSRIEIAMGLGRRQMLGKTTTETHPDWTEYQAKIQTVIDSGQETDLEMTLTDRNGDTRHHHIHFVAEREPNGIVQGVLAIGHDITARKRMETALRESERQFRTLAENAPDHIARYDRQCRRIYVNPAIQKSIGLEQRQVIGMTPMQTNTVRADWAAYQAHIQSVIDSEQETEMEFALTDGEGETSHFHLRFVAERGTDDAIQGVLMIGRDITQRKRREIQENIRLRIFELLAQGAELLEALNLIVEYVERSDTRFLGSIMLVAPDGKHLLSTCAPNLPEDYSAAVNGIAIGEGFGSCGTAVWRGETVIADDVNTHPYWAPYKHLALANGLRSCWSEPIFDAVGKVLGTFGIYQRSPAYPTADDLELVRRACHFAAIAIERKRMETALRESERQFRTLAENSPNIIMRYDMDCRRIYVNPAYERKTGVSYDKARGKTPLQQWGIGSVSAEEYINTIRQVLDSGNADNILMEWPHPETGKLTSHDIHIVPEYGPDGKISGALAIGHSVTELMLAERKLKESNALLRELTGHREAAREEERRRIARELHDELGQQLMALRLNTNLLLLRFGKHKPLLREAISNLLQLVDSTIQVTRDVSTSLRPAVLDMGIVPALEWLAQEFSRRTGISCELTALQGDICTQEAQAIALFRIAQETLTNAARHAQAGQVQITLDCKADGCLLEVKDNGIGFDTGLPRKQQSYGLIGLRERALTVGGELTVSSTPGSGTVVRVRVPIGCC